MIHHFVITRLGFGIYDERRLAKMIDLFGAVTAPSLAHQNSRDFTWLVTIDANMPGKWRAAIERLVAGHRNAFVLEIDVARLIRVHAGCFDWVWDHCQDYLLRNGLVEDPHRYVTTSNLDADDAWACDVVATVNRLAAEKLPVLEQAESKRATWTRHSAGTVVTFSIGLDWFLAENRIGLTDYAFHSMAIFVTARFSSGISVCSSRHSHWPAYARVAGFQILKLRTKKPMWIYGRHDEQVMTFKVNPGARPVHARLEDRLHADFGVDLEAVRRWRSRYRVQPEAVNPRRRAADTYDLIFRIAALNRKLAALEARGGEISAAEEPLAARIAACRAERQRLVDRLRE
jgi:hypothetical protein